MDRTKCGYGTAQEGTVAALIRRISTEDQFRLPFIIESAAYALCKAKMLGGPCYAHFRQMYGVQRNQISFSSTAKLR
jgi:hypothetical protein